MFSRVLKLGLSIDWVRISPVLVLAALAAIRPVGLPILLGRTIDTALQGAGLVEVLPLLGLVALLAVWSWLAVGW